VAPRRHLRPAVPPWVDEHKVASADWEVFRGWGASERAAPRVALRRDRSLSLNAAAYDLLGRPAEVHLLFSASRRAIGIRAALEDIGQRFHVRQERKDTRYVVEAAPFIRYYEIDHSQWTVFETVQFENDILVLPLDQARRRPTPTGE
jgi:hypothetical protein